MTAFPSIFVSHCSPLAAGRESDLADWAELAPFARHLEKSRDTHP